MSETMNGPSEGQTKFIDTIDPDDPEYVRQLRRPAEVKEDLSRMEDRSRVSNVLKTQAFREELEEIVADQLKSGPHPASLLALQQISELLLPQSRSGSSGGIGRFASPAIPISDIRGVDSLNFSKGEKILRCKVASAYRLSDIFGWSQSGGCITARISQDYEHFLLAPHGQLHGEVTASSLLRVSLQGEVLDTGSTTLNISKNNFALHAAVHAARPDLKVLVHIRNPQAVAVSAMNFGVLPMSQEALALGEVSSIAYSGCCSDQDESDKLTRTLGPTNRVLILQSFGILVGGDTVEDAFKTATNLMTALDIQLRALPVGLDNLQMPSEETRKKVHELANQVPPSEEGRRKWRRGEIEFEGFMRYLDNAGFRTGHSYHEPYSRRGERRDKINTDVEIPPTSSSHYHDDMTGSPLKQHFDKQKKAFKSEWLNTPNSYKKEEFDETGTPNPKKITRWVSESDEQSTSVKVDNPNQFAPQGENPKEFRQKHEAIRKEYYTDKIDAGPQSRILEGMSWEEAQRIKDGHVSGTSDSMIVVGAASKGIIKRDHQHNAVVYKTYYAPNPFDNMSAEEIEKYKKEVESGGVKPEEGKGDAPEATDLQPAPEGHLISSDERMQQVKQSQDPTATIEVKTDDLDTLTPPSGSVELQRAHSARATSEQKELVDELKQTNFGRSKSDRRQKKRSPLNGDQPAGSPTKSTSSGEGVIDEPGSPAHEAAAEHESPSKDGKKKKKRGLRILSFSKGKKDSKETAAAK